MLAPEALRLVIVEILRPTTALEGGVDFPTAAGRRVYDSREIPVQDIDHDQDYTPVIAVHSNDARIVSRGPMTDFADADQHAVIDIVVELAVVAEDTDGMFADAMAGSDPQARLVLAALCSKIRYLLEFSDQGAPWRKLVKRIVELEEIPFAVPDIGLRFQRMTLRYTIETMPDRYSSDGGLPEPIRSVLEALPAKSYARGKLEQLGAYFEAVTPDALHEISGSVELPGGQEMPFGIDGQTP